MSLFFALRSRHSRGWLRLAGLAAGLAAGTKYTAVLAVVPVLFAGLQAGKDRKDRVRIGLEILFLFALAFFVTTPGAIFDFQCFSRDLKEQILIYGRWGHAPYNVSPGLGHFFLVLQYLCLAAFSKYAAIACAIFILALLGLRVLLKQEQKTALFFLCFPALYIILLSAQKVMIIRNLMALLPFFALLAARGFFYLRDNFIKSRPMRLFFSILIIGALSLNAGWLIRAAGSIKNKGRADYPSQLSAYLWRNPDKQFLVSPKVYQALVDLNQPLPQNIFKDHSALGSAFIFYLSEIPAGEREFVNRFKYGLFWFGPYEVNFNYYPTWIAGERIVVMPSNAAGK